MKKPDLLYTTVNGLLSLTMGVAVCGCISSAYQLPNPALPELLTCLVWAVLTCLGLQYRRGGTVMLSGLVLWGLLLWALDAGSQFGTLVYTVFSVCSRAYHLQIPGGLSDFAAGEVSLAMSVIGGSVTLLAGLSFTRLHSGTLAVTTCVLTMLPCMLVTDMVPHTAFLFMLFSAIALTVLGQGLRRRDPRRASRLTAMLLLPILVANAFLFACNPRQTYDKQPSWKWLEELFDPSIGPGEPPANTQIPGVTLNPLIPGLTVGEMDLRNVGPKQETSELVMEVKTDLSDVLYLRGKSYCTYDGFSWVSDYTGSDVLWIYDREFQQSSIGKEYFIRVSPKYAPGYRFTPYYPTYENGLKDGALSAPDRETEYTLEINPLREDWQAIYRERKPDMTLADVKDLTQYAYDAWFKALPQNTLARAQEILKENGITDEMYAIDAAEAIADIVRSSAQYSLDTGYMPADARDFALWFLEESDSGYCVHFATATAVLLRAAGIPARYVEGYVTRLEDNGRGRVTADQAHAWVEYFLPDAGWIMLEPTPSAGWMPPADATLPNTRPTTPSQPDASATEPPSLIHPVATALPSMPSRNPVPTKVHAGNQAQEPSVLEKSLQWAQIVILVAAALAVQWLLRRKLREVWLHRGSANTQALRRWRFVRRLAWLRHQEAPAALKTLAQKAKFSQHTISSEELAAFDGYFARSIAHLQSRNWMMRLVYRLIFAVY